MVETVERLPMPRAVATFMQGDFLFSHKTLFGPIMTVIMNLIKTFPSVCVK